MFCIFSERQLGSQARISPCGQFIACLCPDGQGASRLQIRSLRSGLDKTGRTSEYMRVTNLFQCVDKIDSFEISSDSQFVLCCMLARSAVQVFSLVDSSWKCRINEGVAGLTAAWWAPDATRIVTESDFGVHMSVWSLRDATSSIISLPKPILSLSGGQHSPISITRTNSGAGGKGNACRNAAFSPCGRFLAVLHRSDLQDKIAVYAVGTSGGGADGSDCGEISRFKCRPGTSSGSSDIAAICWITNPSVAADPALPLPADTSDPHPRGVSFSAQLIAVDSPLAYRFSVYTPMGEVSTRPPCLCRRIANLLICWSFFFYFVVAVGQLRGLSGRARNQSAGNIGQPQLSQI